MSYSIIHQLLDNGLTEEELIASLAKSLPHVANKARKMFMGGWSPKQMLNEFSKDKKVQQSARNLKPVTPSEIAALHLMNSQTNIPQGASEKSQEELTNFTKMAAPAALGTLAAPMAEAALSRALPKVPGLLRTALGSQATNAGTSLLPQAGSGQGPSQNSQGMQSAVPSSSPGSVSDSIPQSTNAIQGNSNPEEYLAKLGVLDKVKSMLKTGNTPEAIMALLTSEGGTKRGKTDPELLANIEAYAKKSSEMAEMAGKQPKNDRNVAEIQPKSSIGNMVATPHGVGEVLAQRGKDSIIDIDGKKTKVSTSELIGSPLPQKDMADLYEDLLRGIEGETGEQVSRNVNVAAYDPNNNSLAYIPHGGALYLYDNLSPEDQAIVTNALKTRKSTGSNHIGAWSEGTKSPMGAQMYELIRKLQSERGGKGNEYARKYDMVYRALGAAEESHKDKYKKKKKPK